MQLQRVPGEPFDQRDTAENLAAERLAEHGTIVIGGPLTPEIASVIAARFLALAAIRPGQPIALRLAGVTGSVGAALMLHDVIAGCGAPVHVSAAGTIDTAGAVILRAGGAGQRELAPTASVHLTRVTDPTTTGLDVERGAEEVAMLRRHAEAVLGTSLDRARLLSPEQAVSEGLADRISPSRIR